MMSLLTRYLSKQQVEYEYHEFLITVLEFRSVYMCFFLVFLFCFVVVTIRYFLLVSIWRVYYVDVMRRVLIVVLIYCICSLSMLYRGKAKLLCMKELIFWSVICYLSGLIIETMSIGMKLDWFAELLEIFTIVCF